VTALPGPRASEIIEADTRWVSPSYTRSYPFVAARGRGALVEDVDGNRFLDFNAGIAVCATGHCHPEVVGAVQEQAARLIHMSGTDFYYALLPEVASLVASLIPFGSDWKTYFGNSGAEAVEAAMKLARFATGRGNFIAFHRAFHGRTLGALSLTNSKPVQRRRFGPLVPGVTHVPFPDPFRDGPDSAARAVDYILDVVFRTTLSPDEVAAVVVETIQGEGGYVVPPADFFPRLQALAREHGILIVADEVQCGMGRTGKMFAFEHFDFEPDIITLAKGVASGMPLGLMLAQSKVMNWGPGAHASTFGGNPLCLAAARETVRLLGAGYMENAAAMGELLKGGLDGLKSRHRVIGDVRGLGLMIGIELVGDRASKTPAPELRDRVVERAFRKGLLVLGAGASTIRLSPPLLIDEDQCRFALDTLDHSIAEAVG
jgi:4-aminobutyrate aminotransferase